MHSSESLLDIGNLERGGVTSSGLPPRAHKEHSRKVLPIEHPGKDDSFLQAENQTESGTVVGELLDISGWKKGGWKGLLEGLFPCIRWMKSYKWKEYLQADVIAGVTVGTMLVPQAMSYAKLAGLNPIYGLYSSVVPVLTYAILGSSRQLSVGPVAMVSLLVSNALLPIVDPSKSQTEEGQDEAERLYTELAIQLALLVGIIECLMGLVRLGWLIRFISHSVVSGFTTGSAVIIGLSQAKSFVGYEISRSSKLITIVESIIDGSSEFKWEPFLMGSVTLALLLVMKQLGKTFKQLRFMRAIGPLTGMIFGIAFVKIFRPANISLVGTVPPGLPSFSLHYNFAYTKNLVPHAFLVTGVGILESVGIAQALAAKNGYEIDSNQELFGLGISNLFGSAFSSSPVAGSFSRSAVMNESGAKTGLSGIVVFILICGALLFFTPVFTDIPECGLAAIIISAVIGLLDYDEAIFLWRVAKRDLFLWTATCLFTLFFGVEVGVLVGAGFSLVFVIYESANPHTAILGRLPGTTVYRNTQQYPDAYTYYGIVIIRVDAPMYFANISFIKEKLRNCEHYVGSSNRRGVNVDGVSYIIFDMSPVTYVDASAVHAIIELYYNYKARGIQLALCNPNRTVMTTLARAGVPDLIGHEWYFVRVHDAVQTCISHTQALTIKRESSAEEGHAIPVDINDSPRHARSARREFWAADGSESRALLSDHCSNSLDHRSSNTSDERSPSAPHHVGTTPSR
ncbi:unnamed protein product [Calypogeia fissa]